MAIGGQHYGPFYPALSQSQGIPTAYDQLKQLDWLIELSERISQDKANSPLWDFGIFPNKSENYAPVFLVTEFHARVERVLADMGRENPAARSVLQSFRNLDLWQPKTGFDFSNPAAPQPTADTYKKYAALTERVRTWLAKLRDKVFFSCEPSTYTQIGTPEKQRRFRTRKALSGTDRERCKRIGRDEIARHSNAVLWKEHRYREKEKNPKLTYPAFRQSLNRIRRFLRLPSSKTLSQKSDQLATAKVANGATPTRSVRASKPFSVSKRPTH